MSLKGERLRELRQGKSMTQQAVAEKLGINVSTYNTWEKGRVSPNVEYLQKLVELFETSADYLLGNSEVDVPPLKARRIERNGIEWEILRAPRSEREQKAIEAFSGILKGESVASLSQNIELMETDLDKQEQAIYKIAKDAVYEHLVEVKVHPESRNTTLENELKERFKYKRVVRTYDYRLLDARVVNNPMDESFQTTEDFMPLIIGALAKDFFMERLEQDKSLTTIGIVSGYYPACFLKAIRRGELPTDRKLAIYPLCLEPSLEFNANFSNVTSGNYLVADFLYRHREYNITGGVLQPVGYTLQDGRAVLEDNSIQRVLDLASRADIVFLGMGALAFCEPGTLFYEIILAAGSSPKQLRENYGAVGDILFQLLDKEGNLIQDSPLEKKFKNCSINPEILKRMGNPELQKTVVILSSGARRGEAILAGLRGGYLNTAIIDNHLAQELLYLDERV